MGNYGYGGRNERRERLNQFTHYQENNILFNK